MPAFENFWEVYSNLFHSTVVLKHFEACFTHHSRATVKSGQGPSEIILIQQSHSKLNKDLLSPSSTRFLGLQKPLSWLLAAQWRWRFGFKPEVLEILLKLCYSTKLSRRTAWVFFSHPWAIRKYWSNILYMIHLVFSSVCMIWLIWYVISGAVTGNHPNLCVLG